MFRLKLEEFKAQFENKYNSDPLKDHAGTPFQYNGIRSLQGVIKVYINKELKKLDGELYDFFKSKTNRTGYGTANLFRVFSTTNSKWNPSSELVDLLCWFTFGMSFEASVLEGKISNDVVSFKKLRRY